MFSESEKP